MNSLLGVELPTSVTFIIAFVIVLALIGAAAWLVRRFGAARLAAGRGRQPRLAVIDAASVDGRRKLIIIRRDNVEHLLMIGGPTDVVVETNILRAGAASPRDAAAPRPAVDTLPRAAVPLPDAASWPQPEPLVASRVERPRALADEPPLTAPLRPLPEPPPRVQTPTDPLIGLAAELSRAKPEPAPRVAEPPRIPLTASYTNGDTPIVPIAPTPAPAPAPAAPAASPAPNAAESHLAEMAQRLENALRRPLAATTSPSRPSPVLEVKRLDSKPIQYPEQKPPIASNGPTNGAQAEGAPAKSAYEDLEQEMASLLGRQSGKS
jgi:hypothetical protein